MFQKMRIHQRSGNYRQIMPKLMPTVNRKQMPTRKNKYLHVSLPRSFNRLASAFYEKSHKHMKNKIFWTKIIRKRVSVIGKYNNENRRQYAIDEWTSLLPSFAHLVCPIASNVNKSVSIFIERLHLVLQPQARLANSAIEIDLFVYFAGTLHCLLSRYSSENYDFPHMMFNR